MYLVNYTKLDSQKKAWTEELCKSHERGIYRDETRCIMDMPIGLVHSVISESQSKMCGSGNWPDIVGSMQKNSHL